MPPSGLGSGHGTRGTAEIRRFRQFVLRSSALPSRKRQHDAVFEPALRSSAMRSVAHVVRMVAAKDVTLTLVGESGTGKEVVARMAHAMSARRAGPFVPINCAAIPDTLFESELFGHERGAFTGAVARARGKIEAAEGGSLFLDEIGELPGSLQAKLLRFLENRRFMRVGGATKIDADVRVMVATARPLEEEVRAGRFRADLYYRIHGITIEVPPLRERRADILPLVEQFIRHFSSRHKVAAPRLSRRARAWLVAHDWPGNVRELRNVVEALCLLRPGRAVGLEHLPSRVDPVERDSLTRAGQTDTLEVRLTEPLAHTTARIIAAVLQAEDGNKRRAASRLGISIRTLQRYAAAGRVV
jgi:transcriptional regulator with PAS, ATPase and Fis domain